MVAFAQRVRAQEHGALRAGKVDRQGLWPRINEALHTKTRLMLKTAMHSAAVIDSQSVKDGQLPPLSCGYDAGKKIKERKRDVLTDTNVLLLGAVVTPASVQDRDGAKLLLCIFCHSFVNLLMIIADGGYAVRLGYFVQRMGQLFGHATSFGLGIIKKLEDQKGFIVPPRRWVIERSFGWLVKQWRLTRDHEKNPRHHEAFIYLAFIGIMSQHLTALQSVQLFAG